MATLQIELNNGDIVEINFNTEGPVLYWKPTSLGILIKRYDKSRTIYPWISIKCYTIYPTDYKDTSNEEL